jgi:hypothetical protein
VTTLLDEVIPTYDVASRHALRIAASPDRVYSAARMADLGRPPLVRLLMGIRALPAVLLRRPRRVRTRADRTVGPTGFTLVAERAGEEFVLGVTGRFWQVSGGLVHASAEELRRGPGPGLAQGFWNFRVEPDPAGAILSTETRVRCADRETRARFQRYWWLIRPGSGLIRRSMLRHIRRLAERE